MNAFATAASFHNTFLVSSHMYPENPRCDTSNPGFNSVNVGFTSSEMYS